MLRHRSGMTYFNAVVRLSETVVGDDGKERVAARCVACGLVWGSMPLAIECAVRGHRNRYVVEYTREHLIDGKVALVELTFVRQALRRDGPRPAAPVSVPVAQTPELDLQALRALALAQGFRLTRVPAPRTPKTPEPTLRDMINDQDMEPAF